MAMQCHSVFILILHCLLKLFSSSLHCNISLCNIYESTCTCICMQLGMVLEVYVQQLFLLANFTWSWSYHKQKCCNLCHLFHYGMVDDTKQIWKCCNLCRYLTVVWLTARNKYKGVGEFSFFSIVVCAWSTCPNYRPSNILTNVTMN